VQLELGHIESLSREIDDLTMALRGRLPPEQFRLVWLLRDAVERLGLAEEMAREEQLIGNLARHLPECSNAIHAVRRHICTVDAAIDDPV
jgi:hypothetical protein